jgi:hypothetical protein
MGAAPRAATATKAIAHTLRHAEFMAIMIAYFGLMLEERRDVLDSGNEA